MPFITTVKKPREYQISFEDLLNGIDSLQFEANTVNTFDTRTVYRERTPTRLLQIVDIEQMIQVLEAFNAKYAHLISLPDKAQLYRSFKIPKRHGGLRQINAPNEELDIALRELRYILEKRLFATYHTAAFAYIKGRCGVKAIQRHQTNNSKWFLKLDFHNFFGSSTIDFVLKMFSMTFPFNEIMSTARGYNALKDAMSLCFLDGGLPQGTPISPAITNQMMIPIDHAIAKYSREHSPHLCYTRYADDILLSSDLSFENGYISKIMSLGEVLAAVDDIQYDNTVQITEIKADGFFYGYTCGSTRTKAILAMLKDKGRECTTRDITVHIHNKNYYHNKINQLIQETTPKTSVLKDIIELLSKIGAPFALSVSKTRYGSRAGNNYNLGVMLNKDNQITVGHEKKKQFKAMLCSFACDYKAHNSHSTWPIDDIRRLQGLRSYYASVEKETIDGIVKNYSAKFGVDIDGTIKNILSNN